MNRLLLFILISSITFGAFSKLDDSNIALAKQLGESFSRLDEQMAHTHEKIDSLRAILEMAPHGSQSFFHNERLGDYYVGLDVDSAIFYWQMARQDANMAGDFDNTKRIDFKIISFYPHKGLVLQAVKELEWEDVDGLNDNLKIQYYTTASSVYCMMQEHYSKGKHKDYYKQKTIEMLDSMLNYYPTASPDYGFIVSVQHYLSGEEHLAIANIHQLLQYFEDAPQTYEMALERMILYYKDKPLERQEYIKRIFMLTNTTMQRGVVNPVVMAEAGKILYDEGYTNLGRSMMLRAMQNKMVGISHLGTFDYYNYIEYLANKALRVRILFAIVIFLLIAGFIIITVLFIRRKKTTRKMISELEQKNATYEAANAALQQSLDSAVALSFINNEQLHEFFVFVQRKLKAGQARELYREISSGEYMEELQRSFFEAFDELFMENFPGFFDKLNDLLQPDKQLTLAAGNHLTPEMRIAAFMKFGMTDSNKLSKAFGLSLNTIYAYRNRLKGRAKNRATFEDDIRNII